MFKSSVLMALSFRPWRELPSGEREELDGAFILATPQLLEELAAGLSPPEAEELRSWAHSMTEAEAAEWHVPLWAGETQALYIRVPAQTWDRPSAPVADAMAPDFTPVSDAPARAAGAPTIDAEGGSLATTELSLETSEPPAKVRAYFGSLYQPEPFSLTG